jgi:hypothetical protein
MSDAETVLMKLAAAERLAALVETSLAHIDHGELPPKFMVESLRTKWAEYRVLPGIGEPEGSAKADRGGDFDGSWDLE